jgi:lysozyme
MTDFPGTLFYPDIYSGDHGINFNSSYIVVAKATQGTWYTDPFYGEYMDTAHNESVFFCAYHFLEAGNDAAQQAEHYAKVVNADTPGMLDIETNPANNTRPTIANAVTFLKECNTLGRKVYLSYLPEWYWKDLGEPSLEPLIELNQSLVSSNYPAEGYTANGPGWDSYGGMTPKAWQYSATVNYGGMPEVDFNAFKGSGSADIQTTLEEFRNLVMTGKM